MPPQLATLLTALLILYLFVINRSHKVEGVSRAINIPFLWMLFAGSRFLSQWLNLAPADPSADAYFEGSPIDRAVFVLLILGGILVLRKRHLDWRALSRNNLWILLYFLFGLLSIFWSDCSSSKRLDASSTWRSSSGICP